MVNTFLGQLELTNFATGWCMSNVEMFSPWPLVGVFAIIYVYSSQVLGRNKDEQKQQKYATALTHELAAAAEPAKPNLPGQSQFHVRLKNMGWYISQPFTV